MGIMEACLQFHMTGSPDTCMVAQMVLKQGNLYPDLQAEKEARERGRVRQTGSGLDLWNFKAYLPPVTHFYPKGHTYFNNDRLPSPSIPFKWCHSLGDSKWAYRGNVYSNHHSCMCLCLVPLVVPTMQSVFDSNSYLTSTEKLGSTGNRSSELTVASMLPGKQSWASFVFHTIPVSVS